MASADLDHIRALLIAQTADPPPKPKGFGRWFAPRRPANAPLTLETPPPAPARPPAPAAFSDPDQELLLSHICGPSMMVEQASPLPPPSPRSAFGRRGDLADEVELMLVEPAAEPRRLRVLDDAGAPVGEMILHAVEPPLRTVYAAKEDAHAAPFFPEDLMEPERPALGAPRDPSEPLRPWIKALRAAARPNPEPAPAPPVAPQPKPPAKRRRPSAKAKPAPVPPPEPTLGHDLLEALALALSREQAALEDRLAVVVEETLLEPKAA